MKTNAYKVFLRGKQIDTVFSTDNSRESMRKSLINHDGYDPEISVVKSRPRKPGSYTDTDKDRIGAALGAALGMKRIPGRRDRWNVPGWCTGGGYSNIGLFNVLERIGEEIKTGVIEETLNR